MLLQSGRAFFAIGPQATGRLRAHADAVTDFDSLFNLGADAHGVPDDLVSDDTWVQRRAPAVCRSEAQMPQCVTLMSTSLSSKRLGS